MSSEKRSLRTFHVRVGLWTIQLRAHDADEAVEIARRQLGAELPRLYDVIRSFAAARFQVEAAA